MESADINWLAVVVAAVVPMVLGALWYSPALFAGPWLRSVGRTPEELTGAQLGYALSAVAALVTSAVLAYVVDWAAADGFLDGLFTGVVVWLGFVATSNVVGDRCRLPAPLARADGRDPRHLGLAAGRVG